MNEPPQTTRTVPLSALDGFRLTATLVEGPAPPRGTVLLAPGVGIPRRVYRAFQERLAAAGYAALAWDWRGIGDSRPATSHGFDATLTDWATKDLAGAIAWGAARGHPCVLVAHSFGGQAAGLAPNLGDLAGLVTVAAQSGYWGLWPRPQRYALAALWHVVMPGLSRMVGYFPSRLVGLGENLPLGAALEWSSWCRSPDYLGDYAGHRAFGGPLLALSFSDDFYAPRRAVVELHRRYASAALDHRHFSPADLGVRRIGHLGFFRRGVTPTLWDQTVAWLDRRSA